MKRGLKKLGAATLSLAMIASAIPGNAVKTASAYTPGNYSYANDYTLGHQGSIVAYVDGVRKSLKDAGVKVYDKEDDRPFKAEEQQQWDADVITLTQPVKFTTNDGEAHDVESMLTNFDFIADPTAIDNTDVDGKLYVYGTTEGFTYKGGVMSDNEYNNHSLTILSSSDMVNWTDEGFMDSANLTGLPSYEESQYVKGRFTSGKSWAPSGLKYDYDGDGKYTYYLFYTQGGSTGYVMSDSPTGPWKDPGNDHKDDPDWKVALFDHSSPNCSDCSTCFDPAVLVDNKGNAYVYFGGLTRTSARGCKVTFNKETGEVEPDGDPVKLGNHAHFEDNEINQFNGKYYYSYCTDFSPQAITGTGTIAVYVSNDPLHFGFDPTKRDKGEECTAFTGEDGIYRHFLGTVLKNPSSIYGQSYNNHHHMQEFKGHTYIFYHSTVLNNTIHRSSHQYRNLHVDEIEVDPVTDDITCEATYEGAAQIEDFNPYFNMDGSHKIINATTTSFSAGIKSTRDDEMVVGSKNGSPMVVDEIDTGDWTKIQGVKFSSKPTKFTAEVSSPTADGAIEVFVDDPTEAKNLVATVPLKVTDGYEMISTDINMPDIDSKHDLYFVFRGEDYRVASWVFDSPETAATPAPSVTPATTPSATPAATPSAAPSATPAATVDTSKVQKVGSNNYKITDAKAKTVSYTGPVKKTVKSVTIPASVKIDGVSYKVTAIAANAFKGCSKLTKVTVGKNIKTIGASAFAGCSKLKTITVKSTVLSKVGSKALKGINAKAQIKVSKKKLAAYKKIFKGKGQGKRVKIK